MSNEKNHPGAVGLYAYDLEIDDRLRLLLRATVERLTTTRTQTETAAPPGAPAKPRSSDGETR